MREFKVSRGDGKIRHEMDQQVGVVSALLWALYWTVAG